MMGEMVTKQIKVGPMENFVYVLFDEETRAGMVIDSGWETAPIVEFVSEERVSVKYVVATHGHFDHVKTLRQLADALGAKLVAHEYSELDADIRVRDGDKLTVGDITVTVLYTPGHTKDSICLFDGREVFTGDTLFIGNCGRTDLPGGSTEQLFRSLQDVLMKLPPSTVIYPGHDYGEVPSRSLGKESRSNPTLRARDLREFAGIT